MEFLREIEEVFDSFSGRHLSSFYTKKIDDHLIKLFNSIESRNPLALIAIGGYGRAELAPYSDIDIMFFAKDKADSKKVKVILYKLWDAGLTVGHCYRTSDECLIEAKKDARTHTSLLEARFLAGDADLYTHFIENVYSELAYRKQKNFIKTKLKEMEKRHSDYGGSVFLLEPNLKEGQGGLRDIHTILWLSKIAFKIKGIDDLSRLISSHDHRRLLNAYDFLLKVRFCLHLMSKRRNDVLSFDTHEHVAKRLGFHNSKKFMGSERFMRYLYLKANVVKDVTSTIAGICCRQWLGDIKRKYNFRKKKVTDNFCIYKDVIIRTKKDTIKRKHEWVIEAFYAYAKTGKKFSYLLKDDLRRSLLNINKSLRNSQKAAIFFLKIFGSKRIYETLREMHDIGVIGRYIPEFGALKSLVVYEPYHRYTVDEHTLLAIKHLEQLNATTYKSFEHLSEVMTQISEKESLFMALLFHDIGKAAGKYHEKEGYKRLKNIIGRLNLNAEQRQRIEFLVKNHTLMFGISLKRETDDPEVIAQFADAVGDEKNLKSLYLMTYADMAAVNPMFWTEWKACLLKDLYEKTLKYLRGVRENPDAYIDTVLSAYGETDRDSMDIFLREMPERYLLSTTAEKISEDFKLAKMVKDKDFAVSINERPDGTTEITIGAWDCAGLFSKIVGFLSSKWLNILRAKLYTGKNGLVIDRLQISNWKDIWWDGMDDFIRNGLREVILEDKPINITNMKKVVTTRFEAFIEMDNETSEENTIIEFFSEDRLGLLYDVSKLFYEKNLNIVSAKINTEAGIAHNIFYIQRKNNTNTALKTMELMGTLWETLKG